MTDVLSRLAAALGQSYRVERELGAGGMATVYLAHDLKHDRDVAIKVLHPDLGAALGGERFLSEIRTTARLQHPHILPLLDSGDADGFLYYVMPLVTGETLRARLERERQLPIADAIRIAREVASALDYAHRQNVIHRDIKPENILLHDGSALVADFGIALAVQSAGGQRMTQTGLSLGTPQYMSPEQAMGERTIDARSDIYALGAVTYEMLSGDAPFVGSSVQAIVAKVLSEKPTSLHTLRDTVPPHVEHAVFTALAKLPADRFGTAAEFSTGLSDPTRFASSQVTTTFRGNRAASRRVMYAACAVSLASVAFGVWGWSQRQPHNEEVTRIAVALPITQQFVPQWRGYSIALSNDGTRLAYVGAGPTPNTSQLWVRPLDALEGTAVPNTAGASTVRFGVDGKSLLYSAGTNTASAAIVSLVNNQITQVTEAYDGDAGASGRVYVGVRGRILRQTPGGATDTIVRFDGAAPLTVTVLPNESGAIISLKRDSASVYAETRLFGVSFASGKLTEIGLGIYAQYLSSGQLLYVQASGEAFVAPFDVEHFRLTARGVQVARVAVTADAGRLYPQITVSQNGTLAYVSGNVQQQRLTWLDPNGRVIQRLASEGNFWGVALSPDGFRVALATRQDEREKGATNRGIGDVWVEDLRTGARTQLTSTNFNVRPSWSADGAYVLYTRLGGPLGQALIERRADASTPERVVATHKSFKRTVGDGRWLPDHRTLIVRTYAEPGTGRNIYYIHTDGSDTTVAVVAASPGDEMAPAPSPDGSLVAYNSDEAGSMELYVQPFPSGHGRLQVSHGGAGPPRWSRDGKLYYWDHRNRLIVVTLQTRPALAMTSQREIGGDVIPAPEAGGSTIGFDVTPDGRILVAEPVTSAYSLVLVRNFMTGLAKGANK